MHSISSYNPIQTHIHICTEHMYLPIITSPLLLYPTMDGTIRPPLTGIITGFPPSIIEIAEFVVPKSIPIIGKKKYKEDEKLAGISIKKRFPTDKCHFILSAI